MSEVFLPMDYYRQFAKLQTSGKTEVQTFFSAYKFKGYFLTGLKGQTISDISLIADKAPIIIIVSVQC